MTGVHSELLASVPGLAHGFGTRLEPVPGVFGDDWNRLRPAWRQVHGTGVAEVTTPGQECGQVDALFSRSPGQPIAVVTADCVPVLLARRDGGAVAAVHAGWRGTRANIVRALWAQLRAEGETASDWVAAVGPAIGPCCYEVDESLAADFEREFKAAGPGLAVPRYRILDLPAINAYELRDLGLGEVELLRSCTRCSKNGDGFLFHSYRREGGGTRQYSMIRVRAPSNFVSP